MSDDRRRPPTASMPPPRPRSPDEAYDRLQALETRLAVYEERTDQRLSAGAATMGELKAAVSDLKPKRQALIPWAAVAIAIGGIIFRAGNYPDRVELDRVGERSAEEVGKLREEVRSLEREIVRMRTAVESRDDDTKERLERVERRQESPARRAK